MKVMALVVGGVWIAWAAGAGGCATHDRYTPTQLDALQQRVVEAGPDAAFAAASGAVMDSGYIVGVNDAQLRILTGTRRRDPSPAEHAAMMAATAAVSLGSVVLPAPPSYHTVAIQVLGVGPERSTVRIRTFVDGVALHDAETIEELWVLTERRLLGANPPSPPTPPIPPASPTRPAPAGEGK